MSNDSFKPSRKALFKQINETRGQLSDLSDVLFKVQCVEESQKYVEPNSEDEPQKLLVYSEKVALEKIQTIRELALSRKSTLKQLLGFYMDLYLTTDENKQAAAK